MQLLLLSALLLHGFIHTARSEIFNHSGTQGRDVSLFCQNEGRVTWEKGTDRGRSAILSAEKGEITKKHKPDPEKNRYSVLNTDSSLLIKNLSLSDSGIYYCNAVPVVNLTVYPPPAAAGKGPNSDSSPKDRTNDRSSASTPVNGSSTNSTKTTTAGKVSNSDSKDHTLTSTPTSTTGSRSTTTSTKKRKAGKGPKSTRPPKGKGPKSDSSPKDRTNDRSSASTPVTRSSTTSTKTTDHTLTSTPTSTTVSRSSTTSTKKRTAGKGPKSTLAPKGLIIAAVLAGVGLLVLAVILLRCYLKKKAAKASKTDHVYETINDASVPATQPGSAPQKVYEAIYILAGDPDVVKLGLKNQTADSPLIPKTQSTKNPSEMVYSTVQAVNTTSEMVYSTVQAVDTAVRNEDIPALQLNVE